jgi:GTP 3',8-cyclase
MNASAPLTDRFGRRHTYLRISVTDRCNLRCLYCMPHTGMVFKPREELLRYEEILRIARVLVSQGVTKIRITGGEPLVRQDLEVLVAQLDGLRHLTHGAGLRTLALTTNGTLLADKAQRLKDAGLQALNISLDTLRRDRFARIARRDNFHEVMAGIDCALATGFESLKLNVVVIGGFNEDEVMDFVAFGKDKPLNLRFIEFMPFKGNQWDEAQVVPWRHIKRRIEEHYELIPLASEASAVAKDFQIAGHPGSVSFITSMTDSFCGTCNRLRLTADGHVKACLFQPAEIQLRDALRCGMTDEALSRRIHEALLLKQEAHDPMASLAQVDNRPMIAIGG